MVIPTAVPASPGFGIPSSSQDSKKCPLSKKPWPVSVPTAVPASPGFGIPSSSQDSKKRPLSKKPWPVSVPTAVWLSPGQELTSHSIQRRLCSGGAQTARPDSLSRLWMNFSNPDMAIPWSLSMRLDWEYHLLQLVVERTISLVSAVLNVPYVCFAQEGYHGMFPASFPATFARRRVLKGGCSIDAPYHEKQNPDLSLMSHCSLPIPSPRPCRQ